MIHNLVIVYLKCSQSVSTIKGNWPVSFMYDWPICKFISLLMWKLCNPNEQKHLKQFFFFFLLCVAELALIAYPKTRYFSSSKAVWKTQHCCFFHIITHWDTVIRKHALLTLQRLIYLSKFVKIRKKINNNNKNIDWFEPMYGILSAFSKQRNILLNVAWLYKLVYSGLLTYLM